MKFDEVYSSHTFIRCKRWIWLIVAWWHKDMFKLDILKWFSRYCHKQLPVYFQQFNILRHSDIHNYATGNNSFIPRNVTRLHATKRCLRNLVSVVLSNTCDDIINKINTHSYEGFAAYVKKYIISSYSTECSIENCYVCGAWLLKNVIRKLLCVYVFKCLSLLVLNATDIW